MTPEQMKLWDKFATAALAAIVAKAPYGETTQPATAEHVRRRACGAAFYADAMLTERTKRAEAK